MPLALRVRSLCLVGPHGRPRCRFFTSGGEPGKVSVLVLNVGARAVEYGLISVDSRPIDYTWSQKDVTLLASGEVGRIGGDRAIVSLVPGATTGKAMVKYETTSPIKDYDDGVVEVLRILTDPKKGVLSSVNEIPIVGHRVAHGFQESKPVIIDDKVRPFTMCTSRIWG